MRAVSFPELTFSPWISWGNHLEFPLIKCPGVYLVAISSINLEGELPSFADVHYVGMTVSKGGLAQRWRNFDRAINDSNGKHSGGRRILKALGPYSKWERELFVSAFAIDAKFQETSVKNLITKGIVTYLEYETMAKVFTKTGKLPEFNILGR
jgi:hypothetical protein